MSATDVFSISLSTPLYHGRRWHLAESCSNNSVIY